MSDGAEYCGKSGEIKEKREYLEAESRGLGVSPSWMLSMAAKPFILTINSVRRFCYSLEF